MAKDIGAGFDVEADGRLVQQQQPRLAGQRHRDLQPLLLAMRQGGRGVLRAVRQTELGQQRHDLIVQGVQIAQGNRKDVDWAKTGQATLDGAIGGAISGGIGFGAGKIPGVGDAAATPLDLSGNPEDVAEPARTEKLDKLDKELGLTPCLILSVTENGYGKRTDVDAYRLQSRGGKGVINMKTTPKIGKVTSINLVDDTTEMMVISQFGKIIRIDTKTVRGAGRNTSGVRLLNLESDDKVASATVIPPDESKTNGEGGLPIQ